MRHGRQAFFPTAHRLIWTYFVNLSRKPHTWCQREIVLGTTLSTPRLMGIHVSSRTSRSAYAIFSKQATGLSLNLATRVSLWTRSRLQVALASTYILAKHFWTLYSTWRILALRRIRRSSHLVWMEGFRRREQCHLYRKQTGLNPFHRDWNLSLIHI